MRLWSKIAADTHFVACHVLPSPARAWIRRAIKNAGNGQAARRRLRAAIRECGSPLKVIVGAGDTSLVGWIATDYPLVDITDLNSMKSWFGIGSVQAFLAEHVWEHLVPAQAQAAAVNCYRLLVPGGHLRIAVPDGLHPNPEYIDHVKPGGTGPGSDEHQVLYTYRTLGGLLEAAGFEVHLLEWFDEAATFHFRAWNPNDGFVSRSTHYDERNAHDPTIFTSIIADAVKPGARPHRVERDVREATICRSRTTASRQPERTFADRP